ncbi:sugar ABC transporter substrate-binding protein [Rhodococcus pyridinivorans]|uniref:sugar ABC transporter substrate-binding protein n=1 Tax=Rhodococcus pyridinivorans TaxID=103816 RepID=UPI002658CDF5|nr:sugar ABC transporter substrate-binding protein [Rhodococcus pyridinivorans]
MTMLQKHRIRRITFALTASLATMTAATACGAPGVPTDNDDWPTIAFLVPMDRNHEYGRNYVSALREAAEENHVNAFVMNSNYDASVQASQMKIAIAKKVDGIVIWPALYGAEEPMLVQAERAGIPVNISNSQPPEILDPSLFHAFTGPNDQRIGELQGKELAKLLGGKGTYVYIGGTPGNAAAINRQIGLEREMANHPDITLLGSQPGNFDKNQAQTAASALISRFGNQIDAVVTPDDIMASGAAQALEAAGMAGKVMLLGHNYAPVARSMLEKGTMSTTLFQSPCWDSTHALTTMMDVLNGKDVPEVSYMPLPVVTKDNLDEFTPNGCLPDDYSDNATN